MLYQVQGYVIWHEMWQGDYVWWIWKDWDDLISRLYPIICLEWKKTIKYLSA